MRLRDTSIIVVDNSNSNQRDVTFDIMKGIGILLVLLGHVWVEYLPITTHVIYSFHMPMFFFVAGYFTKTYDEWSRTRDAIKKCFARLVIPMAFTQLLSIVWSFFLVLTKGYNWNEVIAKSLSLFWADVYGPPTSFGQLTIGIIWFLMALFVSKSLLMVLWRLKAWLISVSFALALCAIMLHKVFPYSIWCISLSFTAMPFLTIGWYVKSRPVPLWMGLSLIVCWIVALFFPNLDMHGFTWPCYLLNVIGAFGGTYCLYLISNWISANFKRVSCLFSFLGVISLAILCVHCFEVESHLGNHLRVLFGFNLSIWGMYVWRYSLTIVLAIILVHIPKIKQIFV